MCVCVEGKRGRSVSLSNASMPRNSYNEVCVCVCMCVCVCVGRGKGDDL